MKTLLIILLLAFLSLFSFAQAPDGFNYQGIARDNKGKELTNQNIRLRISILISTSTGTAVYTESFNLLTNSFGLFNVKVGTGTVISGNFMKIDWSNGIYFLKVEMDPAGGTNYVFMGSTQLISVPYSLMANVALKSLNDLDTSSLNELQILNFSNDTLYLDKGGYVYLGKYDDKNAIQAIKTKLNFDSTYFDTRLNDERTERQNNYISLNTKISSDSNYLNGLINTNTTDLNNETNSRVAAEQGLKTKQLADSNFLHTIINNTNDNLNTETNSRITGDNNLKSKQIADSSYLKGIVTTETTNRTSADNNLDTRINTVQAKESSDSAQFANYLTTISTNLTTETNNRTSGDNTLQSNINNENSARSTADNGIRSKVVSDSSYLKGLINTNTTNLNTEITNRTNSDNTLQTNITIESNSRISGDNSIRSKMVSDSSSLRTIINSTSTNLTSETNSRISSDNNLKSKQISDSTYLKGLINSESTTRSNDDNTLQSNITTETNSRVSADNSLKSKHVSDSTYLKGLINTEITNRSNADSTLQSHVVTLTGNQSISGNKLFTDTINAGNLNITNIANPINAHDAVTKSYVDELKLKIKLLEDYFIDLGVYKTIDIDSNQYHVVRIGNQSWFKENLRTSRLNDSTIIPLITSGSVWTNLTSSGYCWYNNDSANYEIPYGKLYNWYSVNTSKLCPIGWRVPTYSDWITLITFLGGSGNAGGKLKEVGFSHWLSPNTGATNEFGFTALPGGSRYNNGTFHSITDGWWWSSTDNNNYPWIIQMSYHLSDGMMGNLFKNNGNSVRCMRD
jgi:uncharacterized protein (TIGR02145 family)